ncbi:DUF1661 domain-containing protein [Porphyromonas gingivalis]|nr:DUF1661 domain-containing protein [Porphyromonas gingivalis]
MPKFLHLLLLKTWRGIFLLLVRETKKSRAKAKKFSRRFFRI